MRQQTVKSNILLLLAASIWGFAFVAQRVSMNYIGAFTFNGIRFLLGSVSLIPLIIFFSKDKGKNMKKSKLKKSIFYGILAGVFLFLACSFQQVGLAGTTVGRAAFITGLYIVLVPIFGIFLKQYINVNSWIGAIIAVIGLYVLCVTTEFNISYYDLLELASAFFFAIHILLIDYFVKNVNGLKLAFFQFLTCSFLSLIIAILFENIKVNDILQAGGPILYGGICSVGFAYTLQIFGQEYSEPSHSAIILSMESVFATIGGFFILKEYLSFKDVIGCTLMLIGMIVSQIRVIKKSKQNF